jgi:hypothetical protein
LQDVEALLKDLGAARVGDGEDVALDVELDAGVAGLPNVSNKSADAVWREGVGWGKALWTKRSIRKSHFRRTRGRPRLLRI